MEGTAELNRDTDGFIQDFWSHVSLHVSWPFWLLLPCCPGTEATEAGAEREPMTGTDTRDGGMIGGKDWETGGRSEQSKQRALGSIFSHYYFRT